MERKSILDHYEIRGTLGVGGFAKVKRALDTTTQTEVALKIIRIKKTDKNDRDAIQRAREPFLRYLHNEAEALNRISHPNVMRIHEVVGEDSMYHMKCGTSYPTPYLAMELMTKGDLFDVLSYTGPLEEELARVYFRQLLEAVRACHESGISHRDIKPENVLLDAEFNLKLADFGFAIATSGRDGTALLHTNRGTPSYMAPEILMKLPYSGVSVDLFACGLILFIMIRGRPALSMKAEQSDFLYNLLLTDTPSFWVEHSRKSPFVVFSPDFRVLIQRMLALNPNDRPTLQMVLEDPWVNGPAYTLEEAHLRMETRYQNAAQKAAARKEAEKARKMQLAARRGGMYKGDLGSSSESGYSDSSMVSSPNLKRLNTFLSGTEKFSRIFTSLTAEQVQMRLYDIFGGMQAEVLEENANRFKFLVKLQKEILCSVELFDVENGTICVDLTKIEGSRWEFMQEFNSLNEQFLKIGKDRD